MELYRINYPGMWIGGTMIVRARSEGEALEIGLNICSVFKSDWADSPEKCNITPISNDSILIHHDNGDY